jgi:hypothetical protein
MKGLCSQAVARQHVWGSSPVMALQRRLHPRPQGVCPGAWLHKGGQEGMIGAKAIDFYAFSWGVPRKPACNVVETAQRKSQERLLGPSFSQQVIFIQELKEMLN